MRSFRVVLTASAFMLFLTGCIYTHTVQPLTLDMRHTPVGNIEKEGTIKMIAFPPVFYSIPLVAWGSAAIGDVAREQGMKEVYFADVEIFSVLRVWNEYTVHVYGK